MQLLNTTMNRIVKPDKSAYEKAKERLKQQARPAGSLGILEEVGALL